MNEEFPIDDPIYGNKDKETKLRFSAVGYEILGDHLEI
jgi:hypothetical protein